MDFYGAQEGVTPVERVVVCGAGSTIPGLADRIRSGLGLEISQETPASSPTSIPRTPPASPSPTDSRSGSDLDAPRQPDPPGRARQRSRPDAHRRLLLRPHRRPGASPCSASSRWRSPASRSPTASPRWPSCSVEEQQATAKANSLQAFANFRAVQEQRSSTVTSLAQSRFDWQRVLNELARVVPSNVWLVQLAGTVNPAVTVDDAPDISIRDRASPDPLSRWSVAPRARTP